LTVSSPYSYREIALVDIAVCYSQTGEGEKSKQAYQRILAEFPDKMVAQVALKAIEAFEQK
jgi:hypothetical protein